MKKWLLITILALFISPLYANDIYVTQSGDDLDLDITQDGQNNVAGTSQTAIGLTGDTMTFSISQVGNSNVVSTIINGDTYTGNINLTGSSNNVALLCSSGGAGNCETVSMSIDVTGSSADIDVTIGNSAAATNYVGTIDITSTNDETFTLTANAANADADIDITNNAQGSSVGNTANYTQTGAGDSAGHSLTHSHTGEGATIDVTQTGIYDNKIQMTTSGDDADIDISQSD
tara:strand:- start:888 stop:1583 length:696 start_codon:yes stop_codon:yes gene_type:complete